MRVQFNQNPFCDYYLKSSISRISVCIFSIKYQHSDILLKNNFIYKRFVLLQSHLLLCWHGFCDVSVTYVTPASRYQSRSSMYVRGLIPGNSRELAEAVPIEHLIFIYECQDGTHCVFHDMYC